ncbi:MAG: gliding motility-associated C-terminal protein [Cytophagaceae bacterium]|nr:gliding motility-associated C-terminal protein [Cytophagaceae bacterium]
MTLRHQNGCKRFLFLVVVLSLFLKVSVSAQVTYTCGTDVYKACGPNLAVNGNFADMTCPPTTFSSQLIAQCAPNPAVFTQTLGPGHFHLTTSANLWNGPWASTDHTGDGSGILIGDASNAGDRVIWSQDIVVTAGETYYFSSYGTNIAGSAFPGPGLTFSIDGTQFFKNVIPNRSWQHICTVWTAPVSGPISIKIFLDAGTFGGHDVGIDDILFQTVCPVNECKVNLPDSTSICLHESTTLQGNGAGNFSWSPSSGLSDPSIANPVASPLNTTTYTLTVTDIFNCSAKDSIVVVVDPLPVVTLKADTMICEDSEINVSVFFQNASYLWNTGSISNAIQINEAGVYTVETTLGNCKATNSINVTSYVCCEGNFIPNLITPNGDGLNDTFNIGCVGRDQWVLKVYNRWGSLVYANENYQNQWDAKGLSDGVYYFNLEKKKGVSYKGWLQVVR